MIRKRFIRDRRGSNLVETALTLPLLILVTLGLVNLALAGIAGLHANNAANYGARRGSVAQTGSASVAASAAWEKLSSVSLGEYGVNVSASGGRGGTVNVVVSYRVPNYFAGLAAFFGGGMSPYMEGQALSTFRHEGW
jgi:Flp pilus assembly protein TadG